ncbi:hypothetical protein, partial [Microbacterium tenebrionis]|uniref:hypothetical protein n=1 Tax=Microbacterium tenebrionis TaxID=2830665 RepID=UPI00202B3589
MARSTGPALPTPAPTNAASRGTAASAWPTTAAIAASIDAGVASRPVACLLRLPRTRGPSEVT